MIGKRLEQANKIAGKLYKKYNDSFDQFMFENYHPDDYTKVFPGFGIIGIYRKVRKPCSCYMCGNPRRHFGKRTLQEIRLLDDYEYLEAMGK